jgi:hypothetical protein
LDKFIVNSLNIGFAVLHEEEQDGENPSKYNITKYLVFGVTNASGSLFNIG